MEYCVRQKDLPAAMLPNYDPIDYTGGDEEFSVNISPEELKSLKDQASVIQFHKVLEWCLPQFSVNEITPTLSLFQWQAERMSNYLRWLLEKEYEPGEKWFTPLFDTRSWFKHNAPVAESMTKDCLLDLY